MRPSCVGLGLLIPVIKERRAEGTREKEIRESSESEMGGGSLKP